MKIFTATVLIGLFFVTSLFANDRLDLSKQLLTIDNSSKAEKEEDDNNSNLALEETIISTDFNRYTTGKKGRFFYKDLSTNILNNFDFITALIPDNFRSMVTPVDSSSPYSRYSNTFYGDESGNQFNIGLEASNLLLDTVFEELTNKYLTLNLARTNKQTNDIDALKIQANPLSWLKLIYVIDLKSASALKTNRIELEFNPTSRTAVIFRNVDNSTETQTGIEFRLDF